MAVYPRPRGGTQHVDNGAWFCPGLSPPTRGNLAEQWAMAGRARSIPAHAGEPRSGRRKTSNPKVYPRPRGGTRDAPRRCAFAPGLSPPTRGNLGGLARIALKPRSIPAHAGEPNVGLAPSRLAEVYPRPRGGTGPPALAMLRWAGLSPPTRGNPAHWRSRNAHTGSIPAHAGEPTPTAAASALSAVYPRPRGGTLKALVEKPPPLGLSPPTRGNRRDAAHLAGN